VTGVGGVPEALLAGVRVVDLAAEPAAMSGRILADLGADVIKVEPPGGDPLRWVAPVGPDGTSLRFTAWTAGKTCVEVTGTDDPRLAELLGDADVVLDTRAGPAPWTSTRRGRPARCGCTSPPSAPTAPGRAGGPPTWA